MKLRQIARKHRREAAKKTTLTLASGLLFSLAAGNTWADCTGGGGVYTCSGPTTALQTVMGFFSPLQTDITNTFTGSLTGGNAVTVYNFEAIGATAITTAGDFSTDLGTGLYAQNFAGGDLSVRQTGGSISGPVGAISATILGASGTGAITITQDGGTLSSSLGYAIYALNVADGGINITQNAGTSSGGTYGFQVTNQGSGNVAIAQASAGLISGGEYGIYAVNEGGSVDSGSVNITTAGTVAGDGMAGIYVTDQGIMTNGQDITITQNGGTITSQSGYGIQATNYGTGVLSITTNGTVTGGGADGIYAQNATGTTGDMTINQTGGTITGTAQGIYAENYGTGAVNITTAGDVEGVMQRGLLVNNYANGGDVNIAQTAGTIRATNSQGVYVNNASAGDVNITQTAGTISGSQNGISVENPGNGADSGSVAISTAGNVTGNANAIYVSDMG